VSAPTARPAGRSRFAARLLGERGAAAVEFALVVPLLLLVLAGIVMASQAFQTNARLSASAREGARVMALNGDVTAAVAAVHGAAGDLEIPDSGITISRPTCESAGASETVSVTVVYAESFGAGIFGVDGIDLTGRAVMRCGG
jgi:Flp pilus assembly protein TadG